MPLMLHSTSDLWQLQHQLRQATERTIFAPWQFDGFGGNGTGWAKFEMDFLVLCTAIGLRGQLSLVENLTIENSVGQLDGLRIWHVTALDKRDRIGWKWMK